MSNFDSHWTTEQEMAFLNGLGKHRGKLKNKEITRLQLLKIYYEASTKRERWGGTNKYAVLGHCMELIRKEEG